MYTYYHKHDGYSRRHEGRLCNADGTPAPSMLITRYTYRYTWQTNGVQGPRGGKARKQRKKNVFYFQGVFYRAKNIHLEDGRKLNSYEVFDGVIFDCFEVSSRKQGVPVVRIELVEGIPVQVMDESGEVVWSYFDDGIAELEDMLAIPEQDRAPQSDEAENTENTDETTENTEETTEIVKAAEEIVAAEAARLRWIESTTAQGEQISLFAYAGYAGENTWQELAYAGR